MLDVVIVDDALRWDDRFLIRLADGDPGGITPTRWRVYAQRVLRTGDYETTNIPGLYVAGDAFRRVQLADVAAAEGAEEAFAINPVLLKDDLR